MEDFYDTLIGLLQTDERFFAEDGTFLRNVAVEAAMTMDEQLIKLLLRNPETYDRFFTEAAGVVVFDKVQFSWVVNNREFLPDSYTAFKNKIGLATSDGRMLATAGDVSLVFPYKDCVLEGGQTREDQDRDEIFYNEVLAPDKVDRLLYPKVFTGARRYSKEGVEGISAFSEDDNLIIKGNNMLVVASLLRRYRGRIKCIYIDPPFNPPSDANTFSYNNTFNRATWLVFMKTRLQLAKSLLKNDGVLIVAIDKNEQPRLQILIEELFPEYDVDCITVIHNPRGTEGTNFSYTNEFAIFVTPKGQKTICDRLLEPEEVRWNPLRNWGGESLRTDARNCFYPIIVKDDEIIGFGDILPEDIHPKAQTERHGDEYYVYPIDGEGVERKWRYARQSVDSIKDMLRVKRTRTGYDIEFGKTFGLHKTVWVDPKFDASSNGTRLLKSILPDTVFSYPKSLYTVIECIESVVRDDENALILDFFGGSGTTGHAVMEINRQYGGNRHFILVEQMDYVESDTLMRNLAVMNEIAPEDTITYFELSKLNQNFAEEIEAAEDDDDLTGIYCRMLDSGFISYKVDPQAVNENIDEYEELPFEDKQRFLMEILDKNLLYVNYCDIDDEEFDIPEQDKTFTKSLYGEE